MAEYRPIGNSRGERERRLTRTDLWDASCQANCYTSARIVAFCSNESSVHIMQYSELVEDTYRDRCRVAQVVCSCKISASDAGVVHTHFHRALRQALQKSWVNYKLATYVRECKTPIALKYTLWRYLRVSIISNSGIDNRPTIQNQSPSIYLYIYTTIYILSSKRIKHIRLLTEGAGHFSAVSHALARRSNGPPPATCGGGGGGGYTAWRRRRRSSDDGELPAAGPQERGPAGEQ